ncbi:hypothetical protein HDA36_001456 [Nocardiopsis composta]|uniref:Uncharacterized protein n=1 Tax=Nocardiopsis composta TaxID=157465 RepID=A0A7W8QJ12_9ACTN|nr:hypothetical protein [Nocardiopsis composta]
MTPTRVAAAVILAGGITLRAMYEEEMDREH